MTDDATKVIDTYQRRAVNGEGHAIEDALREERNVLRRKLRDIARMLGCSEDEIVPVLASMGMVDEGTGE